MAIGARFAKWGLGLFIFGVFLTFGIIAHYCAGSRWPNGEAVHAEHHAVVGLPVDAVGRGRAGWRARHGRARSHADAGRARIADAPATESSTALWLCIVGLLGVFAVGYPGYFVFDAIWPSFYYSPVAAGKNAWLLGQALFIARVFRGRDARVQRRAPRARRVPTGA